MSVYFLKKQKKVTLEMFKAHQNNQIKMSTTASASGSTDHHKEGANCPQRTQPPSNISFQEEKAPPPWGCGGVVADPRLTQGQHIYRHLLP